MYQGYQNGNVPQELSMTSSQNSAQRENIEERVNQLQELLKQSYDIFEVYGKEPEALGNMLRAFVDALSDIELKYIMDAFKVWLREQRKMPVPADIREIALLLKRDRLKAQNARKQHSINEDRLTSRFPDKEKHDNGWEKLNFYGQIKLAMDFKAYPAFLQGPLSRVYRIPDEAKCLFKNWADMQDPEKTYLKEFYMRVGETVKKDILRVYKTDKKALEVHNGAS